MLSYIFKNLKQSEYKEVAAEKFENFHNLFAAILAKGISRQLKHGLYREYIDRNENLSTLRGKIDLNGTIQNFINGRRLLKCEYDELSENNFLNQILKTTSMILLRHSEVDNKYKAALKKVMLFFDRIDIINPFSIRWSDIRLQKNNQSYQMLLGICRLILEGMLLTTDDGSYKLSSFVDDQKMCHLYEKFILEYYKKEFPQIKVTPSQIAWVLDDNFSNLLPIMKSDIMLSSGNDILIIDAKFYSHTTQKNYDVNKLHSNNLYQIFTYVKNKALGFNENKVSGLLLYARTDEEIQPDHTYQMSGNKISVKTLDLNKNFSEITKQLNSIVEDHF